MRWPLVWRSTLEAECERNKTAERLMAAGLHSAQHFPIDRENARLRIAVRRAARIMRETLPTVMMPTPFDWLGPTSHDDNCSIRVADWLAAEAEYREPGVPALYGGPEPDPSPDMPDPGVRIRSMP